MLMKLHCCWSLSSVIFCYKCLSDTFQSYFILLFSWLFHCILISVSYFRWPSFHCYLYLETLLTLFCDVLLQVSVHCCSAVPRLNLEECCGGLFGEACAEAKLSAGESSRSENKLAESWHRNRLNGWNSQYLCNGYNGWLAQCTSDWEALVLYTAKCVAQTFLLTDTFIFHTLEKYRSWSWLL